MGIKTCDYCGGSGRDPIVPSQSSCYKCAGTGSYWVQDQIDSQVPDSISNNNGHKLDKQYKLLPFMQSLLDFLNSLPSWVNLIFAVIGGAIGVTLSQATDSSTNTTSWIFGVVGFFIGIIFLRLIVVLFDVSIQLMISIVKLAIVFAIIGGIIYMLLQFR